jgi:hypothetical protein
MGTLGSVEIGRKTRKITFMQSGALAERVSPRQGELLLVPAESCGVLRATCEELRATCEELRATCEELRATSGSLQQGAATLGKSFSSLGKLSNTLFNPFLSRVEVVL